MIKKALYLVFFIVCSNITLADDNKITPDLMQLPPIEVFCIEPVELENISIWVTAARVGPAINKNCQPQRNCQYSFVLPAGVHHEKTTLCPVETARLIAEHTGFYHKRNLPLTIFDGWRWEYSYSLSPIESGMYDLPQNGGCWENSWEAVLTQRGRRPSGLPGIRAGAPVPRRTALRWGSGCGRGSPMAYESGLEHHRSVGCGGLAAPPDPGAARRKAARGSRDAAEFCRSPRRGLLPPNGRDT